MIQLGGHFDEKILPPQKKKKSLFQGCGEQEILFTTLVKIPSYCHFLA